MKHGLAPGGASSDGEATSAVTSNSPARQPLQPLQSGGVGTGRAAMPAEGPRSDAASGAERSAASAGGERPTPLIRLRGVTRTYGQGQAAFQALKGVDLDIEAGDFVAIMGPSGSGKSTAMNTLGCLDTPTSGAYLFRGLHVERLSRDQRARLRRRHLGFVFQGFNLLARTSAQENVELPLLYRGERTAARREAAREALASVGLAGWEHHTPAELSGGQQQRVAIARAIVTRPEVLLADEPTGNLDTQRSEEIMALLTQLNRERGITVLMVTHEPDMAAYARRVVRFVDGVVASDRRVEEGEAAFVRGPGQDIGTKGIDAARGVGAGRAAGLGGGGGGVSSAGACGSGGFAAVGGGRSNAGGGSDGSDGDCASASATLHRPTPTPGEPASAGWPRGAA